MTQKSADDLKDQIDALLPDNDQELITAANVRTVDTDAVDSMMLRGTNTLTENYIPVVGSDGQTVTNSFFNQIGSGDDAGIICDGQFVVGAPMEGREMVVGEGDSYAVVGAWHCDIANTTNQTVTSATDVTTELQSDSGSTADLFGATTAGAYILVYSDQAQYGGVKAKIDTAGTIEPDNVIGEYLSATNTWTAAPFMSTNADTLEQYGNVLAGQSANSEQWRFGFNPLGSIPVDWDELTMNINGIDYTGYFARLRITSAITLDPVIQQIKLHTNRYEVNANGRTEYFGIARYLRTIPVIKTGNADKNPTNQNIDVGVGITEIRFDNEFNNGANDGLILRGVIPEGMDTSIPVQLIVDWYPNDDTSGDVELELEIVSVNEGFVFDGSATPVASISSITTVDTQEEELQRSIFLVNNSNALSGDTIYGSLFRDATGGNADDTYAGDVVITNYQVLGYFWKP